MTFPIVLMLIFLAWINPLSSREWDDLYHAAQLNEIQGHWDKALGGYLKAYELDPTRGEPFYSIARHYRTNGENQLAFFFATEGSKIVEGGESKGISRYHFDEEISIAAFYTAEKREGFEATNRLILKRDVPGTVKQQAYKNVLFYVQPLEGVRFFPIHIELPKLHSGSPFHYNLMNPSIQKTKEGYQLICRTVNFLHDHGSYEMIDGNPNILIHTRNFFVELTKELKVKSQKEMIENFPRFGSYHIRGLEDCRLINHELFTSSTWGATLYEIPQIVLCRMGKPDKKTLPILSMLPLQGPDPARCEKNWLPLTLRGELHMIYSYDPFIVYKPNLDTGECLKALEYVPDWDLSNFRGSAAPIAFDNGYLLLVHEVVQTHERFYLHRFLFLDKGLGIQKASLPFIFQKLGVEYCCSMTVDHGGGHLIMPIGIEDREGLLCVLELDQLRSMLHPLPH